MRNSADETGHYLMPTGCILYPWCILPIFGEHKSLHISYIRISVYYATITQMCMYNMHTFAQVFSAQLFQEGTIFLCMYKNFALFWTATCRKEHLYKILGLYHFCIFGNILLFEHFCICFHISPHTIDQLILFRPVLIHCSAYMTDLFLKTFSHQHITQFSEYSQYIPQKPNSH